MTPRNHNYEINITWTGNRGSGTSGYRAYDRSHVIQINNKVEILSSSDPAFQGDNTKHNPEELFLASLSSCHMLWYLHLCADAGVIVTSYEDKATAVMTEDPERGGFFVSATLNPVVEVGEKSMIEKANVLHEVAHKKCFIANSVNFPVNHNPSCSLAI